MYPSVEAANRALVAAEAKRLGHEISVIRTWMIEDDADFHAECTCGWKSREWRDSSSPHKEGREHLAYVVLHV